MKLMYLFLSLMIVSAKIPLSYAAGADREDIPAAPARPLSPTTLAAQLAALQARLDEQQAQIAQQARQLAAQEEELERQRRQTADGEAAATPDSSGKSPSLGEKVEREARRVVEDVKNEGDRVVNKVEKEWNRWKKRGFRL